MTTPQTPSKVVPERESDWADIEDDDDEEEEASVPIVQIDSLNLGALSLEGSKPAAAVKETGIYYLQ
jgi:hypothetical protein